MTPRQLWLYQFGCWVALGTAVLHVVGFLAAPLLGSGSAAAAAASVRFADGSERALGDLLVGLNLAYAGFLAFIGTAGLAVARRGRDRVELMADVARVLALASLSLLVISLVYFFLVPTLLMAVLLICFTLAAVRPPDAHPAAQPSSAPQDSGTHSAVE